MYQLAILGDALKDFAGIPKSYQILVKNRINLLAQNPRPKGAKKLKGQGYRVRQGSYRILYEVDDIELLIKITSIKHRREAYR